MGEPRKRSAVWKQFTPLQGDKAKCDICGHEYSHKGGSTTNLLRHLAHKHKHIKIVLNERKKDSSAISKSYESMPGCSGSASPSETKSRDSITSNARVRDGFAASIRVKTDRPDDINSMNNDKLQYLCEDAKIETDYITREDGGTTDNDDDQDEQDDIIKHEALLMEVVNEDPLNENGRLEIQYVDQHQKPRKFKSQPKSKRSPEINSMFEIQKFLRQDADSKDDEDSTFFRSILPAVRRLTEDQKLEFKGEVLGVLRKIKQRSNRN